MECSSLSRQHQEPWIGTASPAQIWIALSHPKPWEANALSSIAIGEQNRKHLTSVFGFGFDSRIQIITQSQSKKLVLFFAIAFEREQRLYRVPLSTYDQIQQLHWQDFIDDKPTVQKYLHLESIYLICTNDQHDPCCGKLGQALFEQGGNQANIWQCSHLGGDRFAANVVSLPQGNYYRRVDEHALLAIINAESQKQINLTHFAGRSCYERIIQVAFFYLLQSTPHSSINDWLFVSKEESKPLHFEITFKNKYQKIVCLLIEQINTGIEDFFSCHAATKSEIVYFQCHSLNESSS